MSIGEEMPSPAVRRYMWRDEETGAGYDSFEQVAGVIASRWIAQWLPPHLDDATKQMIANEMAVALFTRRDARAIECFGRLTALIENEPDRDNEGNEKPVFPRVVSPAPVVSAKRKGWLPRFAT